MSILYSGAIKTVFIITNELTHMKEIEKDIVRQKVIVKIFNIIKNTLYYLDRFVNFATKNNDVDRNDVVQTARAPILFGMYIIIFFVLVGGIWGSCAPLDSAATALGVVVTSSNKKIINHQEGGIIANIFVKQGDHIKQGDKLIELKDTKIKSQYESTLSQYRHALATESRLVAERDKQDKIEFPKLLTKDINLYEVARIIHTQESLFQSKKEIYKSEKNALYQRIKQYKKIIEGIQARKIANIKNLEIIRDRLKAMHILYDKGFINKASLLEVEAKEAHFRSEITMVEVEIATNKHMITECEISIINLQNKYTEKTLTELKNAQEQLSHLKEQFNICKDSLNRVIIKSPVDGIVNVLNYHTIGQVILSGYPILEISPINDNLVIEVKVLSKNINSVSEGLVAKIRFSAFKSRTTPLFIGKVVKISPDVVSQAQDRNIQDANTYYIARIEIDMDEFNKIAKIKKLKLHPGMQVEVQIVTGTRTLLRYLLDPITDTMFKAFKEK